MKSLFRGTLATIIALTSCADPDDANRAGQSALVTDAAALEAARLHVLSNLTALGLTAADVNGMVVSDQYTTKHNGVSHVYFQQMLAEIPLYHGILNVNVASDQSVLGTGNRFIANLAGKVNTTVGQVTAVDALANAASLIGVTPPALADARAKLVLFRLPGPSDAVRLAWKLRVEESSDRVWEVLVDAVSGDVLHGTNLVLSDSYLVYASPAESPNHVGAGLPLPPGDGRTLVSGTAADPVASPFGWHDTDGVAGADTIDTTGNNVIAQTDLDDSNSYTPGVESRPTHPEREFVGATCNLAGGPEDYRDAAVINLFYWNNIIHDTLYQHGFDEVAGNFQVNNYGRGGIGDDAVIADAQDGSGTNNANFGTDADGFNPRMQMFVWTGKPALDIHTPATIAGTYDASSGFGPQLTQAGTDGTVELVSDGSANPSQGCTALVGFTPGKVALIDRGSCEFGVKVQNAENAGAVAAIVVNNIDGTPIPMGPGASGGAVTIPNVMVTLQTGASIKAELAAPVTITMRKVLPDRDSDLDSGVIAHEYGHGLSNRLTGGPDQYSGTATCLVNMQQGGEGWSDFVALALTQREGKTGSEPRGIGTYLTFEDDPNAGRGIRPFPYSTDMTINPQTYGDLNDQAPKLAVPHGTGSVWATALWEMYWALVNGVPEMGLPGAGYRQNLNDLTPPLAGNQLALRLVIDGMKFQPCMPSFLDARDAILAADAASGGQNKCTLWHAFAKRGMGVGAQDGEDLTNAVHPSGLPVNLPVPPAGTIPPHQFAVTESFDVPAECNRLPVARDDAATTVEGSAVTIAVLENDSDADGDRVSMLSASPGQHGSTRVNGDGTVTYTPGADYAGQDQFTYRVGDGRGGVATATVTVTVTPVNDAPVAVDDAASTRKNTAIAIAVLANDRDVDGDTLSVGAVGKPTRGTATLEANGSIRYRPAPGFVGTDSFTYTVSDGRGASDSGVVTVTVTR